MLYLISEYIQTDKVLMPSLCKLVLFCVLKRTEIGAKRKSDLEVGDSRMNLFKVVRYIFVLIQTILALQFILDAYNEWNESPAVSSGIVLTILVRYIHLVIEFEFSDTGGCKPGTFSCCIHMYSQFFEMARNYQSNTKNAAKLN